MDIEVSGVHSSSNSTMCRVCFVEKVDLVFLRFSLSIKQWTSQVYGEVQKT